jgi:hypothetical protein
MFLSSEDFRQSSYNKGPQRAVIVPRENDMVRFTVHLADSEVPRDPATGRIDRSKVLVDKIIQVNISELPCALY